jgi:hypothetical protein
VIVLLFCVGAWIGVQHLGYGEFGVARHVVFGGVIQRVINAHVTLEQFQTGLAAAVTADEQWKILAATGRKMGFNELELALDGKHWKESFGAVPASECWQMQIPLNGSGAAYFLIPIEAPIHPSMLASFAGIVWRGLGAAPKESVAPASVPLIRAVEPAEQGVGDA